MFALLFVAALIGQTAAAPASCWTKIAPRTQFGAPDQVRDLQTRVKAGGCEVIGLAWTTTAAPSQESVLLWEAKPQVLWRLTMDRQGPRWEKWAGASKERILADNAADGFTLGAYSQGKGSRGDLDVRRRIREAARARDVRCGAAGELQRPHASRQCSGVSDQVRRLILPPALLLRARPRLRSDTVKRVRCI